MIRQKQEGEPIVIDLTGPDGNVFVLMGIAQRLAKRVGLDGGEIVKRMQSGNYEHAIEVFDAAFGQFVILER